MKYKKQNRVGTIDKFSGTQIDLCENKETWKDHLKISKTVIFAGKYL